MNDIKDRLIEAKRDEAIARAEKAEAEADRLRKELEELQIQLDACTEIKEGRSQALEHWCQRAWAAETDYDRIKDEVMQYVKERNESRDRERKLWDCLNAIYAPDFDSLPTPIPGCGHAVRNEDLDALCKVLGLEEE